jgi:NAD(P)-dependent dehydrogenase (short-subunit alcohol dehydrogenase family)
MQRLKDVVAVVTGASRGGGKGIAVVLGEEGATVYVTGRSVRGEPTTLDRPGMIEDTAEEVTERGGTGIRVRCDHSVDADVEALFERVRAEQRRLDLLVNNAWSGYEMSPDPDLNFWEIELRHWELMYGGGLRASMISSRFGVPLLLPQRRGLIVNIGFALGSRFHGHVFYDTVKTAVNRMSFGMAEDLRPHGIAVLALSPGFMHGERMSLTPERAAMTESTQYVGRAVAALAADPNVLEKSGELLRVFEVAQEYGFTDVDGKQISGFWEEWLAEEEA